MVVSYAGFALGGLNYIILMPRLLEPSDVGLVRIVISAASLLMIFAAFGVNYSLVKLYPAMKHSARRSRALFTWGYLLLALASAVAAGLYAWLRPVISSYYLEKSPLFNDFYFSALPLGLAMAWFAVLEHLAVLVFRTVYSGFLREFLLRLVMTAGIFAAGFGLIELRGLINLMIVSNLAVCFLLAWSLRSEKNFRPTAAFRVFPKTEIRRLLTHNAYFMLSSGVIAAVINIDSMMVGSMTSLAVVGAYAIYANLAQLLTVPQRALMRPLLGLVTDAWKTNDLEKIRALYQKSALMMTLAALWIMAVIWANKSNFLFLLGEEPVYRENFIMFVFLAAGHLANLATSISQYILVTSALYKMDSYINVVFLLLVVLSNYYLIGLYGGPGAAAATMISVVLINLVKWAALKYYYGLDPFSWRQLAVLGIAAAAFLAARLTPPFAWDALPALWNHGADLALRTAGLTAIYLFVLLATRTAPELNKAVFEILQRVQRRSGA